MPDVKRSSEILDHHLGRDLDGVVASASASAEAEVEQSVPNPGPPPPGSSPKVTRRLARLIGMARRFRLTSNRKVTEPDDLRITRRAETIVNEPWEVR